MQSHANCAADAADVDNDDDAVDDANDCDSEVEVKIELFDVLLLAVVALCCCLLLPSSFDCVDGSQGFGFPHPLPWMFDIHTADAVDCDDAAFELFCHLEFLPVNANLHDKTHVKCKVFIAQPNLNICHGLHAACGTYSLTFPCDCHSTSLASMCLLGSLVPQLLKAFL